GIGVVGIADQERDLVAALLRPSRWNRRYREESKKNDEEPAFVHSASFPCRHHRLGRALLPQRVRLTQPSEFIVLVRASAATTADCRGKWRDWGDLYWRTWSMRRSFPIAAIYPGRGSVVSHQ